MNTLQNADLIASFTLADFVRDSVQSVDNGTYFIDRQLGYRIEPRNGGFAVYSSTGFNGVKPTVAAAWEAFQANHR